MGIYRFILAILVALSHTGFQYKGYNPGVVAVVSFLLISGFTMETLLFYNRCNCKKYRAQYSLAL